MVQFPPISKPVASNSVVLLNPDTNRRKTQGWMHRFSEAVPPLGLAYLASVARQEHFTPTIIDQFGTQESDEQVVDRVARANASVLAISALTPTLRRVGSIVRLLRQRCPDTLVVMGHIHATIFSHKVLDAGLADVCVQGEGEETFRDILRRVAAGDPIAGTPATVVKQGSEYIHGPPRPEIIDLDAKPLPNWDALDLWPYQGALLLGVRSQMLPIQQSRGCAYRCTFCGQEAMHLKVRRREIACVVDEIDFFHRRYGTEYFGFLDAYFPVTKSDGLEFCDALMRRGLHKRIRWVTETRVDKVDRELMQAMKNAGCHTIMYGFESGNQKVLDSIDKKTTVEQNLSAMRHTKEAGIITLGLFIIGLPGETHDTIHDTIRHAVELDCDIAKFNIATPLPGSRMFADLVKTRPELADEDPEKFSSWFDGSDGEGTLYAPEGMTSHEVLALQREAMFRFYMRPSLIARHVMRRSVAIETLALGGSVLAYNKAKVALPSLSGLRRGNLLKAGSDR